jgi:hypothetical protein
MTVTLPYTLSNGTPADADEVQANLDALNAERPSFSVYRAGAFSPTPGPLKIAYDTEEWDSHGWFDLAQSRWTPQRAGKYRLSAFQRVPEGAGPLVFVFLYVYKNGALLKVLDGDYPHQGATAEVATPTGSVLVAANGTTDYFEIYAQHSDAGALVFTPGAAFSTFQGEMVS